MKNYKHPDGSEIAFDVGRVVKEAREALETMVAIMTLVGGDDEQMELTYEENRERFARAAARLNSDLACLGTLSWLTPPDAAAEE